MLNPPSNLVEYYNNTLLFFLSSIESQQYFSIDNKNNREQLLLNHYSCNNLRIYNHQTFIDKIGITFTKAIGIDRKALYQYFKNYIISEKVYKAKNKIVQKLQIKINNKEYTIVFWNYHKPYAQGTFFVVLKPDQNFVDFFKPFDQYYNISSIEFTVDLYSHNVDKLYDIISTIIFQKSSRKSFNKSYTSTKYLSNIRKTQMRGLKIYLKYKKHNSSQFIRRVRIEQTVKTTFIKKYFKNINHEEKITISDVCSLNPSVVFNNLQFKLFNFYAHLKNVYKKKNLNKLQQEKIDQALAYHRDKTDKLFFKEMNGHKHTGGLLAVKNNKYFIRYGIKDNRSGTLDKHPFEDFFFKLIQNDTFLK